MDETTPRFQLPFIIPGQAQKEAFHNEALTSIDMVLHAAVEGEPLNAPPSSPGEGECWIIAEGAGGAWGGQNHRLAMWTAAGWRFATPRVGMSVWSKQTGHAVRWDGGGWTAGELDCSGLRVAGLQVVGERQPPVLSPSGGMVIDTEARTAINLLIATLMSHGLVD